MPGDKVTLVRADGTRLEATTEQASRLALLGYREETPAENIAYQGAQGQENYYTAPGQKFSAAIEGGLSGATLGATDYLFGDDSTKARAQYNPGTRMASETLGALAPLLLSGGETAPESVAGIAKAGEATRAGLKLKTPVNLLSDAAKALAPGAEGSLTKSVLKGAIEGGAFGGAGAADHAYLDGDPVTAEAVLHGVGWGALIGGGLGAAGHGIEAVGKHEAAAIDAANAEAKALKDLELARVGRLNEGEQARYASQLEQARAAVKDAVPVGALKTTAGAEYGALQGEVKGLADSMQKATELADTAVKDSIRSAAKQALALSRAGREVGEFSGDINKIQDLYDKVTAAVNKGEFEAATKASEAFTSHMADVAAKVGADIPNPGKALGELISTRAGAAALKEFPTSVEAFASMTPARLESTIAALENIKSLPFEGAKAVTDAATGLSKAMGLESENLRSTWRAAKQLLKDEGKPAQPLRLPRPARVYTPKEPKVPKGKEQEPGLGRKLLGAAFGAKAYGVARAAGAGPGMSYAAFRGVRDMVVNGGKELAGVRAASIARIRDAAASYLPKAGAKIAQSAGPTAGLARTLFGGSDTSTKDPKQLAANRMKEIHDFGPTAADSIYRALEPLSVTQPGLTPALHSAALRSFSALQQLAPKDPGVLSNLKTIWCPSDIHAIVLGKQLEVFHDPVAQADFMLRTGNFDPIKIGALRELAPQTWQQLRLGLLERITQPGVLDKTSYHDQIGLSTMLDIPIHSSMAPEYIATSQQMFLDRAQPLNANPRMGQGGGMPNPSDNVNATESDKTTAR